MYTTRNIIYNVFQHDDIIEEYHVFNNLTDKVTPVYKV